MRSPIKYGTHISSALTIQRLRKEKLSKLNNSEGEVRRSV